MQKMDEVHDLSAPQRFEAGLELHQLVEQYSDSDNNDPPSTVSVQATSSSHGNFFDLQKDLPIGQRYKSVIKIDDHKEQNIEDKGANIGTVNPTTETSHYSGRSRQFHREVIDRQRHVERTHADTPQAGISEQTPHDNVSGLVRVMDRKANRQKQKRNNRVRSSSEDYRPPIKKKKESNSDSDS